MNYDEKYTKYQLSRQFLRRVLRNIYLMPILKQIDGKSIDFGCGVGVLLQKLPAGSLGLEINKYTVAYCLEKGLNVELFDPEFDNYDLKSLDESDGFKTLILSHVLEHLDEPQKIIKKLLFSAKRLGIKKIIIIVPGIKGYKSDKTHKTFIDKTFFIVNDLCEIDDYEIKIHNYFPINLESIGKYFRYHELWII